MKESLIIEKQRLRESLSDPKDWSSSVNLQRFFDFYTKKQSKKYIGLYRPLKDEVSLESLSDSFSWQPVWPTIKDMKSSTMSFAVSKDFSVSSLGFQEPSGDALKEISQNEMEVIFVPGLAFDFKGARLGRGKGFYDRYLSSYKGLKVGVCHWTRFLNRPIPVNPEQDVFMDYILTDRQLFKVNNAHTQMNEVS